MGHFADDFVRLVARQASEQGGIISGDNPTHYNAKNPLRLWVIQVGIIVLFTQLLSLGLRRIRQPRVIAEVIGGVLLGPTVMGRIPHFTNRIFPQESIPLLTLTANIGLVFFLFLVGLEIDTRIIRRNARASLLISVVGLIIPLGLGAALAVPIYHEFIPDRVNFGYFILFVAVAIGITAFPVLCRILTELRLLDSVVGVVTLSAGVGNDVVGWVLLALVVTLVNSSGGLTALYVLLAAAGYVIFLLYPVRWAFHWLARKSGCLESGQPSTFMMTITLLLVLVSALFTDIIGIHAIFGGFVAGLIIPHEGGFAIAIVEKLEDLITLLFLPIYFTLSGLNTNLGLLDNGITWGYVVLICVVAFVSKFCGCFVTAKLCGFNWRESGAIGTLMSCKGLVELIVLNIGLQANILDTRTFSMFVLHALVLTFMTTPLTLIFYPPRHRTRAVDVDGPKEKSGFVTRPSEGTHSGDSDDALSRKTSFAMVFNKVEHLPALMSMTQLLQVPSNSQPRHPSAIGETVSESEVDEKGSGLPMIPTLPATSARPSKPLTVHALRLVELTERTSAVLRSQEASEPELAARDAVLAVFRTFASLHRVVIRAALRVVSADEFAGTVATFASDGGAQMVVLPWAVHAGIGGTIQPLEETVATPGANNPPTASAATYNPFENLFGRGDGSTAVARAQFVRKVFMVSPVDVALFVDRTHLKDAANTGFAGAHGVGHHVFLPFFGGPDDRLALSFVVQLCANPLITATVVRVRRSEDGEEGPRDSVDEAKMLSIPQFTVSGTQGTIGPDTVYGHNNTQTRLVSDTADNLLWNRCANPDSSVLQQTRQALQRISFTERSTARPLRTAIELASSAFRSHAHAQEVPAPIIVIGRSRRMATDSHMRELAEIVNERGPGSVGNEVVKAMGDVATGFIASGTEASLLVLQANSMSVNAP